VRLIGTADEIRDYMPLLKWLLLTGLSLFGFLAAWRYGLVTFMIESDRSYITVVILALYAVFTLHCLYLTVQISREALAGRRVRSRISDGNNSFTVVDGRVILTDGSALDECRVTEHIRNLVIKAELHGETHLDQTLLLRQLAESLRERQGAGWFVADAMLKLGLLGTVIGFIFMLGPISTLDSFDVETLKDALASMSGGMAVALFTTLFGLVGGLLLRLQYYILDEGTRRLFGLITELTEVYVVSILDRSANGRLQPVSA